MVDYREKMSAVGRIPGNFFRREMRPSDHETLTSRLIDRSLRPLFPSDFRFPLTITVTVFGADKESDLTGLAILAASMAVSLSDIPFNGPVIGSTVALSDKEVCLLVPGQLAKGALVDLILSVASDGLIMLEGGAQQADKQTLMTVITEAVERLEGHIPTSLSLSRKMDVRSAL